MPDAVIETHHLRKEYGPTVAVEDLTLRVPRGEVFGFLGPNGAGKSTTVKMLLGLAHPTGGTMRLFGESPRSPKVRARVGFLPEHFRFYEWLKGREFLMVHGRLYGMSPARLRRRVPELLDLVGLSAAADLRLSKFSKGMLQRIGLAQAMLHEPELIFLDEPTSGLDPLGRRLVRDIIARLKAAGTTIFLNSHFLSEVEITCDRVAFIKRGRVIYTAAMHDLLERTTEVMLRVDALSPGLLEALSRLGRPLRTNQTTLSMMVANPEVTPEIARLVHQHGARLYELRPKQASLEEIFVRIVGAGEGDGR